MTKLCKMDDVFYDEGIEEEIPNEKDQTALPQDMIKNECNKIRDLLLMKNREYGNSVIHPLGIFSDLDAIEGVKVRIDDKLSRILCGGKKSIKEDTVLDLIGYLILLRVCESVKHSEMEE